MEHKRGVNMNTKQREVMRAALEAGKLVATVRSRRTGEHITIRLSAKRPSESSGRWVACGLGDAVRVFADVPRSDMGRGDSPGSFRPGGEWAPRPGADPARQWAAQYVYALAAGHRPEHPEAETVMGSHCLRCGRDLTDPVSVERGIGPECYGLVTGSRHQRRGSPQADPDPDPDPDRRPAVR
jgi:hypothetical protein